MPPVNIINFTILHTNAAFRILKPQHEQFWGAHPIAKRKNIRIIHSQLFEFKLSREGEVRRGGGTGRPREGEKGKEGRWRAEVVLPNLSFVRRILICLVRDKMEHSVSLQLNLQLKLRSK